MKKNILLVAFFFHIFILNGYAHIYEIYGPEYTCDGNSTWNEAVMCMSITLNSNNTVSATISKPNGGDFKDDHKPAMYLQRDDNGRYATNLTSSMLYIQSSITLVSDNLDSYIFPDDNILVLYGRMDNEAGDFAWVGPLKIKRASYCPFPAPKLNVPSNGNINISTTKQEFSWFGVNGNAGTPEYRIVVSTDRSFDYFIDGPLDNQGSAYCEHDTLCKTAKISNTFYSGFNLEYATTYYWKVRAGNQNASGVWSEIRSFTTEKRIEYEWKIGSWGSCNASCGSGMKYREIFCIRNDTMQTVSDINCKEFTKPNDAEICTDYSPYLWKTDSWSDCSASCGSGIRTRDVYCIRCDGVKVSDLNCSYSKPVDKESCSGTDCPVCDRDHLYLCNQNNCNDASGYWYNNVCNQYPEPETCDLTHLELCDLNNCSEVGGYSIALR